MFVDERKVFSFNSDAIIFDCWDLVAKLLTFYPLSLIRKLLPSVSSSAGRRGEALESLVLS